jgi:hypothetical protein
VTKRLRIVVFSESIISDIGNPMATTVRAICQALVELGHEVTHLEERGNQALTRMLQTRGYAPMRAFHKNYSQIRYRQYDLPSGSERTVWFARETATADAVVAYPGTPEAVLALVESSAKSRLLWDWLRAGSPDWAKNHLWFDPGVLPTSARSLVGGSSVGRVVVAYDSIHQGDWERFTTISAGTADAPGWKFVPECDLRAIYSDGREVWISVGDLIGEGRVRALLPVAYGATTKIEITDFVIHQINELPDFHNARFRAQWLVDRMMLKLGAHH